MFFLAVAILLCGVVNAQQHGVKRLFRQGAKAEGVRWVDLKTNGMPINISGEELRIDEGQALLFDKTCPEAIREQFARVGGELNDPAYETWIDASKDGTRVRVLAKKGGGKDEEIVVVVIDDDKDQVGIIRLRGVVNRELLQKMVISNP